jgi:glycosyltransferase involved in cell wall biosynthesis
MALVCLGELGWENSWKRNQSMVYQLARLPLFDRVVFVNPRPVWVRDELLYGQGDFFSRVRGLFRAVPRGYNHKIKTCGFVHFVPFKDRFPWAGRFEDGVHLGLLRMMRTGRPYVLLNNHPDFHPKGILHDLMRNATLRVFDLSDDFEEFYEDEHQRSIYRESMAYSCRNSEVVLAVNEHVKQKYAVYNPAIYVVSNATNYWNFHREHYRRVPFIEKIRAHGGPILGHTGTINRVRLDYELLEQLAQSRPHWQFVFVGSADPSFLTLVERHANVHYHPQVAYQELPDWIHAFDAAIIPFRVNRHTLGNDLLKFNDYLAMGKSIVTTDTGGARKYEELIMVANDAAEFTAYVERALAGESDEIRKRRRDLARQNSWEDRARTVQSIFMDHLGRLDRRR